MILVFIVTRYNYFNGCGQEQVTCQQVKDEWLYEKQLSELKKVNRNVLAIAEEHKDQTIGKVLRKSDEELGMDFLKGNLKL